MPAAKAEQALTDDHVMALIHFGEATESSRNPREFSIALPQLSDEPRVEVWRSREPVHVDVEEGLHYASNGELLFGHLLIDEGQFNDVREAARHAYRQVLGFLQAQEFPYLLRVWHYFPDINRLQAGLERYQGFCVGRFEAFSATPGFENTLPAGTAIGTHAPGLMFYFLAAKQPGIPVENPRQLSAFRYQRQHGPRSPSFSRAMLKLWGGECSFFISGTASVVGHETAHPHSSAQQLEETVSNLQALVAKAVERGAVGVAALADVSPLKVYLRDPADYPFVHERLQQVIGPRNHPLYLRGDICRDALRLEIDGLLSARCEV
ncbi:MAG: hypothetical protein JSW10_06395 [Pseudomonadota bacterium]|nr:MAG: hypothetical protein JSW10_06395 [Pseudomonadota bacterium]